MRPTKRKQSQIVNSKTKKKGGVAKKKAAADKKSGQSATFGKKQKAGTNSAVANRDHELNLVQKHGCKFVVGADEAGRGPLAGPVVAAACHVPLDVHIAGVEDSKVRRGRRLYVGCCVQNQATSIL